MSQIAIQIAILTVSDRCSKGQTVDESGPALVKMAEEQLGAHVVAWACVPDELSQIATTLRSWATGDDAIDIILTTGGTGLAPRDVTPEAAMRVIERPHAGLMELARARCGEVTPRTYLSRGVAGVCERTLIITLPGSVRGATETLGALLDVLPHAVETLRGEVQDDGRDEAVAVTGAVVQHDD